MAVLALRSEERIGLGVAIAAHAGLVALLLWHPKGAPVVIAPERIEVTISEDVGLTSTSPNPRSEAAPDIAPEIGEAAPPAPAVEAEPEPAPRPLPRAEPPRPAPKPEPKPVPRAKPEPPKPAPRPVPRPVASPRPVAQPRAATPPKPAPRPVARPAAPAARPAPAAAARPAAKPATSAGANTAARPTTRPGGTRIGADFLSGVSGAQSSSTARGAPAAAAGPAVRSAIGAAISRQLKPHWVAPQGADAELLVTLVRFRLARDGSLVGSPEVVSQSGETSGNAAQKARHAEQAIRAVRLAAPFELPEEYYSAWQTITSRFDKRLSQ